MTTTLQDITYTAEVTVTGGREGHAMSSDGHLSVALQSPSQLGNARGGTNPEQLFAAAFAACFQSALVGQARNIGVDVSRSTVVARVSLGMTEVGQYGLAVELEVTIPGVEPQIAEGLVASAHETCPYSHATRNNIEVTLHTRVS
jgi:Ohr subfamily peroxiredoxin